MKSFRHAALIPLLLVPGLTPARATTATGLSSFDAIEEPVVKYLPGTQVFQPDAFPNLVDLGGGLFRMRNRFNAEGWDGDRDTQNRDRQRAEVKGLGPHQRHGDTFVYSTTWRLNADFHGATGFCHLFQLKATNGDSGAPLITLSIHGDKAAVEANPNGPKLVAREFAWKPGAWQTVRIRVRTSPDADGELLVSVDGDAFQGRTGVALARPDSDEYRPKWGLYRRAAAGAKMGDDYVEHRDVGAEKISPVTAAIDNAVLENEARAVAKNASPEKALAWLQARPATPGRDFALGSIAALWAETRPAAAIAWTEHLPPGRVRRDAIERVFARWADQDTIAAARWLHAHAPNPDLDPLVWLFVTDTTYRYVNRPVALDAAPLVASSDLRAKAFEHVTEIWARQDANAAIDHLQKSPALSPEQKKALVEKLRARGSGRPD